MKLSTITMLALTGLTVPASASDVYRGDLLSTKDTPAVTSANLAGVIVELGLGGGVSNAGISASNGILSAGEDASFAGFAGDVRLRIERVLTPGWNGSVYGDFSLEDVKGTIGNVSGAGIGINISGNQTYGYGGGIQLGRTFNQDTSEVFATVGYHGQHFGLNNTDLSTDLAGLVAGGGIRTLLSQHWVAGAEVQEIMYGSYAPVSGVSISNTETRVMGTLGYKF
jgi:hypothetical protein